MYPFPLWRGRSVVPTRAAAKEMVDENVSIHEVIEVLEEGYDCSASKRGRGILEKCRRHGRGKILKVVVADNMAQFSVIHVGIFG